MRKIKLDAEQVKSLLVNGECGVVGGVYEVSGIEGLYVRFEEGGVLVKVDAPEKRPIGRPRLNREDRVQQKRCVGRPSRTVIRSKEKVGIFIDKAHKFLVGDVCDTVDGRKVDILRFEVKQVSDISDAEWHSMGCNWSMECFADKSKSLHLSQSGLGMDDEVGLYWYKEVSVE